jgi:hypothetical protein
MARFSQAAVRAFSSHPALFPPEAPIDHRKHRGSLPIREGDRVKTERVIRRACGLAIFVVSVLVAGLSTAQAQTTVTAAWDRNTDQHTAGYRVFYGTAPGSYQWNVDAGSQTSVPLTLASGHIYYVTVRGYNSAQQLGPSSNVATIDLRGTTPPPPPPSPPPTAQITATLGANNVATVAWQTTNAASATINGVTVATSGSTTVAVTAQTTFTLVARASDGRTAQASATVTPTSTTPPPTAQISATLESSNSARVTWQTTNAVRATINGQTVPLSGTTTVTVNSATSFTLTAVAADGRAASASASVSPAPPTAPNAPRTLSATVSGTRATLAWQAPTGGGVPTHYLLDVGSSAGQRNIVSGMNVGHVLSVTGTLPLGRYYARVRAANATGISAFSNEVQFRVGRTLRAPTDVRVAWSGTTAMFSWTQAAADTAEDVPTGYVLEAGSAPGLSDIAVLNVGNVAAFNVPVPAGTYYVRLRSVNPLGDSEPSNEVVVRPPGAPERPTNLRSAGSGPNVLLAWNAPTTGSVPAGYVIEAGSAPGLANLAVLPVGNVTSFQTIAPPGTYYVRVRAINAAGSSVASNEIVVQR